MHAIPPFVQHRSKYVACKRYHRDTGPSRQVKGSACGEAPRCSQEGRSGYLRGVGGMQQERHDPQRARTAIVFVVVAVVCVLAGFVVGVVRSHADQAPRPVTVKATVAVDGSS